MKKILSLFLLIILTISCKEDITFNSPAFQATKNGNAWKANDMRAFAEGGGLTIVGTVGTDVVTLHTSSSAIGSYNFGGSNFAIYQDIQPEGVNTFTDISGTIKITQAGSTGVVSGEFEFEVEDADGNKVVFKDGIFYKVPM